jgi:pantetheine-phosphate adenylyltransferase
MMAPPTTKEAPPNGGAKQDAPISAAPEEVDSALLVLRVDGLETGAYTSLGPLIAHAARPTRKRVLILLLSPLFDPEEAKGGINRIAKWHEVQRLLTFVYVEATRVAQAQGRVLIDIDVLLRSQRQVVWEDVGKDAEAVYATADGT